MAYNNLQQFMVDIETTGIDPRTEEVLQIAIIEMNFDKGIWQKGKTWNFYQGTDREPTTKFAKEHMQELYARCKQARKVPPAEVRQMILDFCNECGAKAPNIFFCGWNAGIFDIPFLAHHGYIVPASYDNDVLKGDCHYRVYDLSGALNLMANIRGHNEINMIIKEAQKRSPPLAGSRHDAVYDCERQLHILNGMILMGRDAATAGSAKS
jgi:oligoribonuclease (3'-5' exoribonuclease)